MKPVSPVIPGSNLSEIRIAEHQAQYETLPAIECEGREGVMLSRWELTDEEIERIKETRSIYLYVWTFNRPMQPVLLEVDPLFLEVGPLQE